MVIVKNRTLMFSNREQYLGTSYDDNSTIRMFQVPRISVDGVDIANLTFVANLEKMNGAKVSSYLEKEVRDDVIILHWKIQNEALNPAGTMFLSLRATDTSGDVKWSTYQAPVYSETSTDAPETGGDAILGFEQLVAKGEEFIEKAEEAELERQEAELIREERLNEKFASFDTAISKAEEYAELSGEYSNISRRYAVGYEELYEGSSVDNAKYYMEKAENAKEDAETARNEAEKAKEEIIAVVKVEIATKEKSGIVKPDGKTIDIDEKGTIFLSDELKNDLKNKVVIGDTEPTWNNVLWFNTSYASSGTSVAMVNFTDEQTGIQLNAGGNSYNVNNIFPNEGGEYSYEIQY